MRNNLNLYIALLLITALIFFSLTIFAFGHTESQKISLSASSAVLYQPETQNFLYAKNPNQRLPMASTTKIMTALVVCEQGNVLDRVQIPKEAVGIEGSSMYLKEGEILTVQDVRIHRKTSGAAEVPVFRLLRLPF